MPSIYKLKKKVSSNKDNLIHKLVYNTLKWRNIRKNYIMFNPLCKKCLIKGIVNSVVDVHHIQPISTATSEYEIVKLGFDIDNLEGLCEMHHKEVHKK